MAEIRIGISGWTYPNWRGVFYPPGLAHRCELEYASRRMNAVEINGSFYSLQRPESYRRWYEATPPGFVFAVKGSRFITHMKKLRDIEQPLATFFASGVLRLAEKLGPFLWQFPPNFGFDPDRFARFLSLLPKDTAEAAALAARHDEKLIGRSWTQAEHAGPLRHVFEVRHPSFFSDDFYELLRAHGAALVFADTAGRWPYAEVFTADFVYIRLHGAEQLYVSGYTDAQLAAWADRIRAWSEHDVFVFFDNDAKVHAPFDALRLAAQFGH